MKKSGLFIVILGFLVFSLAGVSYGWQGRMGGMGDPYGLVQDESDFLIHPAGIANGKGIDFYSNYRFTFRDVSDLNYSVGFFDLTGPDSTQRNFGGSGDEREHETLLGAAFPVGPGRMGLFFQYAGRRDDYGVNQNGFEIEGGVIGESLSRNGLHSDLDAFALRLLYGLPMGGFNLGGEIQLAYRHEKNKTKIILEDTILEQPFGVFGEVFNLLPFMFPYDSRYWEAILKGSLVGSIGPAKVAFTLRGGFIFSGDNRLVFNASEDTDIEGFKVKGDVKGWKIGGDLWLRYPLAEGLSLPFLLKVGYEKKTRDGRGPGTGGSLGEIVDYRNRERDFQLEVGGGVDKELTKGTRIAGGIYYGYLWNKKDLWNVISGGTDPVDIFDHSRYPERTEHQVILRLAGEREISPMVAMRMGFNFFYGWVNENFNIRFGEDPASPDFQRLSIDGFHWGVGAFLGGTVKFQRFSFEPFLSGGYQTLKLKGDGSDIDSFINMNSLRKEWLIGGGLSIKF